MAADLRNSSIIYCDYCELKIKTDCDSIEDSNLFLVCNNWKVEKREGWFHYCPDCCKIMNNEK